MVFSQGEQFANRAVLRAKKSGLYTDILWKDLLVDIKKLGMALIDLGIEPQDRIAILSENRPEWAAADLSSLSIGAVTVPIYTSLTADEIGYILKDSNVKLVFISSPELMARILPLQEKLNLKFVLFHAPYRVSGPRIWWLGELLGLGDTAHPHTEQAFWDRLRSGTRNSLASIIYTSGTTGPPKGVMLSHGNFLSNCEAIYEALPIRENDQSLSFLPLSHVFERTAGYYFVLFAGGMISYAETLESVPHNLIETQPTIVTAVPRFYEKFHEKIMESVRQAPAIKRRIFSWALAVGRRWAQKKLEGSPLPFWLAFEHRIADRLVFSQLRHRLGGRLRFFISGGAPLSKELAEFFYSANVLIIEGYGLTETSPVITANRVDRFQFGTVGLPLPGV